MSRIGGYDDVRTSVLGYNVDLAGVRRASAFWACWRSLRRGTRAVTIRAVWPAGLANVWTTIAQVRNAGY